MKSFTIPAEAVKFAREVGISMVCKPLIQRNSRELAELRLKMAWLIGMKVCWEDGQKKGFRQYSDIEYCELSSFMHDFHEYSKRQGFSVTGFYVYQLDTDHETPILLESLDFMCLDQQLKEYTGNGYNAIDFHDLGNTTTLNACNIIVHRKTGQRFKVPSHNFIHEMAK